MCWLFKVNITMLSPSKEQTTIERGSGKLSEKGRYFKRIPTQVMANCGHSMSSDVCSNSKHSSLYQNVISTIIVLIILSISKSYSALPTDLNSPTTTVSSVLQFTSTKVNLFNDTSQHSNITRNNSPSEKWAENANTTVTSISIVDNHVANSSVLNVSTSQRALSPTAKVTAALQTNGSSWSINNAAKSTGGDHWHQHNSDLISHLHCEVSTGEKSLLVENRKHRW